MRIRVRCARVCVSVSVHAQVCNRGCVCVCARVSRVVCVHHCMRMRPTCGAWRCGYASYRWMSIMKINIIYIYCDNMYIYIIRV